MFSGYFNHNTNKSKISTLRSSDPTSPSVETLPVPVRQTNSPSREPWLWPPFSLLRPPRVPLKLDIIPESVLESTGVPNETLNLPGSQLGSPHSPNLKREDTTSL